MQHSNSHCLLLFFWFRSLHLQVVFFGVSLFVNIFFAFFLLCWNYFSVHEIFIILPVIMSIRSLSLIFLIGIILIQISQTNSRYDRRLRISREAEPCGTKYRNNPESKEQNHELDIEMISNDEATDVARESSKIETFLEFKI